MWRRDRPLRNPFVVRVMSTAVGAVNSAQLTETEITGHGYAACSVPRADQCVGQTVIADVIWHGARARDVGGGTHGPILTVFGWRSWNERVQLDGAGAMIRAAAARMYGAVVPDSATRASM